MRGHLVQSAADDIVDREKSPVPTDAELYARAIRVLDERRKRGVADLLVTESTESVHNRPARPRDLRRALRSLPLEPLLARLAAWSVGIVRGRHPVDAVLQYRIAEQLSGGGRRATALVKRIADNPTIALIHEEQLAVLARLALMYSESGDEWPDDGNQHLLDALLAFNSLSYQEIRAGGGSAEDILLRHEVRASAADSENIAMLLRRYGSFSRWAASQDGRNARTYIDLASLFRDATGLTYLEFAAATFAFNVHFRAASVKALAEFKPFLNIDAFCGQVRDDRVLRAWAKQVTITVEKAREALQGGSEALSIAALYPLMNTPVIEVRPGALACPALRYLPNVAAHGLIYRLSRFLEGRGEAKQALNVRSFFAEFLEWHVLSCITHASRHVSNFRIFPEVVYGRDSKRSSDIAAFYGSRAVFIDVNSKRFHTERSILKLDSDAIDADLKAMISSKIGKIDGHVEDFRSGELRYDGVNPGDITEVIGLVVTSQAMARFHSVNKRLASLMTLSRNLRTADYFDLNEIEVLDNAYDGNLDLFDLIDKKMSDKNFRDRSLINYLYFVDRDRLRDRQTPDEIRNDEWFQEILATAKAWGLPEDSLEIPLKEHATEEGT